MYLGEPRASQYAARLAHDPELNLAEALKQLCGCPEADPCCCPTNVPPINDGAGQLYSSSHARRERCMIRIL